MVKKVYSEERIKAIKEKATQYFSKGKFDQALESYLQIWKLNPKEFRIQLKIGEILQKLNRKKEAIAVYKKVSEAYAKEGFLIRAISVCKIILELDQREVDSKNLLASLYAKRGMLRDSEKASGKRIKKSVSKEVSLVGSDELLDEFFAEDLEVIPNVLPEIPLFSELENQAFQALIDTLTPWKVPEGTVICQEKETADSMFIIAHGRVKVTTKDKAEKSIELAQLNPGDFFGEIALFTALPRTATCTACEETDLLEIKRSDFDDIVQRFPGVNVVLHEFYKARILDTVLAKSEIFGILKPELRKELGKRFQAKEFMPASFIVKEGEEGDSMYLIRDGTVEVFTMKNGQEIHLATLKPGDFFGEVGLLSGKKRTASIRAKKKCDIIQLNREDFQWAMKQSPEALQVVQSYIEKRVQNTIKAVMES